MEETTTKASTFELEAASMEEFLRLLEARERDHNRGITYHRPLIREAVCVSELYDAKGSSTGFPMIRRYVIAGFAYGEDLVSYREEISYDIEIPNMPVGEGKKHPADRQKERAEKIRAEIKHWLESMGIEAPVLEGFLHHSADPRAGSAS